MPGWADLSMELYRTRAQWSLLGIFAGCALPIKHLGSEGVGLGAYVLSQQTLAQQAFVTTLGLERLHRSTPRGLRQLSGYNLLRK